MYSDKLLLVRNLIFFTPAAGNQPFMIFHAAKIHSNTCYRVLSGRDNEYRYGAHNANHLTTIVLTV